MFSSSLVWIIAALLAVAAVGAVAYKQRKQRPKARKSPRRDAVDTVTGWQPEATRILTTAELQAMLILKRAAPGAMVLAQVPLSRFLRVPTRNSYTDWLARAGNLNADLLVCDEHSRVLAVIDVRGVNESERARRRHERLLRVLRAAGIDVQVWREDKLPSTASVRAQLANVMDLAPMPAPEPGHPNLAGESLSGLMGLDGARPVSSRPMPLVPQPEATEVLLPHMLPAAAAHAAGAPAMPPLADPVTSDYFDDLALMPHSKTPEPTH